MSTSAHPGSLLPTGNIPTYETDVACNKTSNLASLGDPLIDVSRLSCLTKLHIMSRWAIVIYESDAASEARSNSEDARNAVMHVVRASLVRDIRLRGTDLRVWTTHDCILGTLWSLSSVPFPPHFPSAIVLLSSWLAFTNMRGTAVNSPIPRGLMDLPRRSTTHSNPSQEMITQQGVWATAWIESPRASRAS